MPDLWLLPRPLVLASKSQARRALLAAAGIPFEAIDAGIDESEIKGPMRAAGRQAGEIAARLAQAKALKVSSDLPDRLVLGADQTLSLDGRTLSKPPDLAAAKVQILGMANRTHTLYAALCLARDGAVVAQAQARADLTCRDFSPAFVDCYLDFAGETILQSVGAYAVEGLGIHLFDKIDGEQSTILGLPMLHLLKLLRDSGAVEI